MLLALAMRVLDKAALQQETARKRDKKRKKKRKSKKQRHNSNSSSENDQQPLGKSNIFLTYKILTNRQAS